MEQTSKTEWHPTLADPTGQRESKPRNRGKTMVIDKGLGLHAFEDMIRMAGQHIDMIKLGFGTAVLYPRDILAKKIQLAREFGIVIMPGGTFLEVAIAKEKVDSFFSSVESLGFTAMEVSDGTIDIPRHIRSSLIVRGIEAGLHVVTEYGKKVWGSALHIDELVQTVEIDTGLGALFVTIEGRESGKGVGIFDDNGDFKEGELTQLAKAIPDMSKLMWEAPLKSQQSHLLATFGPDLHIGNVAPEDVMSLEALRRGLRSDTFHFGFPARVSG
ncbi:phosphosulfolactate synthase [Paenibacillus alkalitolerans]|uniref:phosphosulfolactate synthase n=1 Tax=Paenibacillus alkalitolerans TaxID=2799335 RepID=UPI0018F6EE66|nr:phosphosulfolactate synthase [Paenibacillus alkalitolerans]